MNWTNYEKTLKTLDRFSQSDYENVEGSPLQIELFKVGYLIRWKQRYIMRMIRLQLQSLDNSKVWEDYKELTTETVENLIEKYNKLVKIHEYRL